MQFLNEFYKKKIHFIMIIIFYLLILFNEILKRNMLK